MGKEDLLAEIYRELFGRSLLTEEEYQKLMTGLQTERGKDYGFWTNTGASADTGTSGGGTVTVLHDKGGSGAGN